MAQFDVYRVPGHGLVLDCQSSLWHDLRVRLVVPLRSDGGRWTVNERLNPQFNVDGATVRMGTQFARTVDRSALGRPVTSLAEHQESIKAALDLLIFGI